MKRRSKQSKKRPGHSRLLRKWDGRPVQDDKQIAGTARPSMRALRTRLKSDPDDTEARITLAEILVSRDKSHEAIVLLESSHSPLATSTRDAGYWVAARILSFAYAREERFADARRLAEDGAAARPETLDFHYLMAYLTHRTGLHDQSRQYAHYYLSALELAMGSEEIDGCNSTAHLAYEVQNYLGVAEEKLGNVAEALTAYRTALKTRRTFDIAWANLIRLLSIEGQIEEAEDMRRRAQRACPRSPLLSDTPVESAETSARPITTLSVCMIVKNEEEHLPRCLASVRPLVDQMIVVDTGSTDKTVEIAESYGASVYHHAWEGDFSKARNISMGYADSEWILVIDADEELNVEDIPLIRKTIDETDFNAISVSVYNFSAQKRMYTSFLPSIRLFRRSTGAYYDGIVHNQLRFPNEEGVLRIPARIDHYGYGLSPEKMARKVERTRALLEQQLSENADHAFAHFNLAQLLRGAEDALSPEMMEKVVYHAGRAVDLTSPDDPQQRHIHLMALHQLVTGYFNKGDYARAAEYAHRALSLKPDYLDAIISLGHIHSMDGDTAKARQYYREYLDRQAAYDEHGETDHVILLHLRSRHNAQYGLGLVAEMDGEYDEAITWFERCIAEREDYLDVHHRLGVVYYNAGRYDEALFELQRELEFHPENSEARIALADQYVQLGNSAEAYDTLTEAHTADPQNGDLAFRLASLEFDLKRWQDALSHLEYVEADHSLYLNACRLKAEILYQTGGYAESAELYERCLKSNPEDSEILNNLGNCRFKTGEFEAAELLYRQVIDAGQANPQVYRNLGIALAKQDKIDDAIFTLESYVDLNPEDIESFGYLGDLHYGRADYGRAIDEYERVLEFQPSRPDTLVRLGDCYLQRGSVSAALLGYERALNVDPDYKPAWARVREIREFLVTRINEREQSGE